MARVWIAQCLCPQRHCIMATAGEADGEAEARIEIELPLREKLNKWLADRTMNPWCGICRSPVDRWIYEVAPTRWATLEAALPALRRTEAENVAAGTVLGELGGARKPDA
jgi:hypothetical protein